MDRRRFLAELSVLASLGVAGCPSESGETDTPGPADTSGDVPGAATPTATASPAATATETATAADTETETDTGTETDAETPAETSDLPALATDGKWIVDEDGDEVVLRGLATVEPLWGMNYADQRGGDYWESLDRLTDESEGWYPSVVRIPCTTSSYAELGIETYASRFLDPVVEHCAENGVYALIDHHLVREYESDETDRLMRTFWETVAPRYADRSHVFYELYNEPTEPAHWGDDEAAWSAWKSAAQPWVDLVREHAPETPLVVGSPRWTSLPHMAVDDPFEGENLIYAGHIYPDNGAPEAFDGTYGAPAEEIPVMITEFGWDASGSDVDQGTTSGWGEPFFEWLGSYENVSWIGWCYDPVWGPPLVDADWNLLGGDSFAGHAMKRRLYENRENRTPDAVRSSGAAYAGPDDASPPSVPTGVTTEVVSETEFRVRWSAVADRETSTQYYTVYVDGTEEALVDDTRYTVERPAGETYAVTVSATDALSNESAGSESVTHETGVAPSPAAEITEIASAPTIDGDVDDGWSAATAHEFRHVVQGSVDGDGDLDGAWRAGWDDDALYVLVDVTDDERANDSANSYDDDSVEVYVDADGSGGSAYDGENDFQFTFPRGDGEITGTFPQDVDDVQWAQSAADDGYRIECAVPWSVLGVSPAAGHEMGFDVHVNDDDGGDGRDAKLSWAADTDMAWDDPSLFATVELTD